MNEKLLQVDCLIRIQLNYAKNLLPLQIFYKVQAIGLARIFDWGGGPNHKSHAMTSSETLKEEFCVRAKIS